MEQVHSDWGDWLLRDIEESDPDGLRVWYLGCNGFAVKASDGTTVFVDPYLGTGDPPRTVRMVPVPFDSADVREADAVFATHEHTDHVHGPSQGPALANTDATYYAPDASLDVVAEEGWREAWNLDDDRFSEVEEGDAVELGELTVHVEPARDPDADHPVSYVFDHDGRTFFHGGDARPSDDFAAVGERYDIDLGALAFGSVGMIPDKRTGEPERTRWYSDENGIIEAAAQLELERLLPTHWDMWKGLTADPTALFNHARSFDQPESIELLEIGDGTSV